MLYLDLIELLEQAIIYGDFKQCLVNVELLSKSNINSAKLASIPFMSILNIDQLNELDQLNQPWDNLKISIK